MVQESRCEDIITKAWDRPGNLGEKLECLGGRLSVWGRLVLCETKDRIARLEQDLVSLEGGALTVANHTRVVRDREELSKLIIQEEIFWKQRSKVLWLKEGDRNSRFFHAKANHRHQVNSIRRIKKSNGEWTETAEGVQQCILDYFEKVFTSSRPLAEDVHSGTEHLQTVVDIEMAEDLQRPYTETEVTQALFSMSPLKSPGPDGMPPLFYQKFWHVVRSDVISCVLSFLNHFSLPSGFNATNIVLIPKCKQPQSLTQYRPISLSFVPGRLITDNVLLAFETNHFLHTHSKGLKHFMNLKLDISKAYDRVEWSFLRTVLESLSALFRAAAEKGTIPGVAVCRGAPRISHLLFADDTMVFCPDNTDTSQYPLAAQHQLAGALGIHLENKHEVYLRLPAVAFCSKKVLFAALKDRIWRRIQGWHEKTLSQAGKAVLIQAVVQAIPSYAMSCFRLPRTLLQEFQALSANFFWNDGDRRKFIGCRWRMGTGHSVNIWTDPWVPRTPSLRVITPKSSDVHISYVSKLMVAGTGEWDVELIKFL
ncbi:UNVERIFIED_CONTAM: hypothetical protein Scaly_0253100 [Sesamum calycinum]|uniref:Reverse transcriptase domain-containing protein n=1 Tax=Sesamum calycinum TaxID=2727403 RepID=A0AAW2T0V3_9LAMI